MLIPPQSPPLPHLNEIAVHEDVRIGIGSFRGHRLRDEPLLAVHWACQRPLLLFCVSVNTNFESIPIVRWVTVTIGRD